MDFVRGCLALGLACSVVSVAGSARAQVRNEAWDGGYSDKAKVRSDVMFGVSSGLGLAVGRGWLNKAAELGRPEFEANTGAAFGRVSVLWIGGALKDYFVYAIGGVGSSIAGNGLEGSGGAFLVRLEAFPLVTFSRPLSDIGVATTFGVGSYSIKDRDRLVGDGGSMSLFGVTLLHETFRWGTFALGPTLDYQRWFSQSVTVDSITLGVRAAYTTGP